MLVCIFSIIIVFILTRCNDVAAIDINMGCPKAFSISGGMGAALLTKPELIHDVCAYMVLSVLLLAYPVLYCASISCNYSI
jgi:tRNA-dihydrouridine synthase